ncbi:hypothetical protein VRU48_09485 [Pedobacter sp. KR3-3]|uniref:RDD domain-containing protein n=1 Tax=Pedobacter albus TaxID=3113905 RepID=A0ABU7I790_9SPHI|nr:hypothetical protein [Pedobacter sp. KR3-3]MEE1945340.1 hypothetical protein [Pedobacter sp. KR3-3]
MQELEIINLWKQYDEKLEQSLSLNRKNTVAITQLKVKSALATMKPIKIFALLAGITWVGFVDTMIIHLFHVASPYFLVSAIIQTLLSKFAIGTYIYQLILISEVDSSGSVLATQEKLASLRASTLNVARWLWLQLPIWTTFYWSNEMFQSGNAWLWAIQCIVTIAFVVLAIWLFINIKEENKHKKWFRLLFNGSEWTPILESAAFLKEIEHFEKA